MKCQIKWIGLDGKPTPDNNEAVAMAHHHKAIWKCPTGCIDNRIVGYEEEISDSFPICADHLPTLRGMIGKGKGWTVGPLIKQDERTERETNDARN